MKKLVVCLSLACMVGACGGGDDDDDNMMGTDAPPGGGEQFTVTWGPMTIKPAEEGTMCVTKRLGNPEPIKVNQFRNVLGEVSHHFIVYKVNDTQERPEPYPCDPFDGALNPEAVVPIMITQKAEETLTLPPGVAFELDANQMIRLELHYINTTDADLEAEASATATAMNEADFQHAADFLFMGDVDIEIQPMSTATVGPTYFPLPSELDGVNFFAITGHTHKYGTDVKVGIASNNDTYEAMVYAPAQFNWYEPETTTHHPAFQIPTGKAFRFECQYENTSDQTVSFGESANQEMCFFWAYYYPSRGARVCADYQGFQACCPGSSLCNAL